MRDDGRRAKDEQSLVRKERVKLQTPLRLAGCSRRSSPGLASSSSKTRTGRKLLRFFVFFVASSAPLFSFFSCCFRVLFPFPPFSRPTHSHAAHPADNHTPRAPATLSFPTRARRNPLTNTPSAEVCQVTQSGARARALRCVHTLNSHRQPASSKSSRHNPSTMFRSRKRGREVPSKANVSNNKADVATADADAAAPTPAERQQHPVAAFANTVYVDPVVKVRERHLSPHVYTPNAPWRNSPRPVVPRVPPIIVVHNRAEFLTLRPHPLSPHITHTHTHSAPTRDDNTTERVPLRGQEIVPQLGAHV